MAALTHKVSLRRMTPEDLDQAAERIEELEAEAAELRDRLFAQVEAYGSIPPKAEKSRRLEGTCFQFTVSSSSSTEIKDAEVLRIREACPNGLFGQLFREVTKWKLCDGATKLLAATLPEDAPRNLRQLFARAVLTKESAPRLRIARLEHRQAGA